MDFKWFVFHLGEVSGPMSTQLVEDGLSSKKWSKDALIWWRGQKDWVPVSQWRNQIGTMEVKATPQYRHRAWYIAVGGDQTGPMSETDLITQLSKYKNLSSVQVWTDGMEEWEFIFNCHEIADKVGLSRRVHTRVSIVGSVWLHDHPENLQTPFDLETISEGGLGLRKGPKAQIGDHYQMTIKSPFLASPIRVVAKVVYCSIHGDLGFSFHTLSMESKSLVMDYIKRAKAVSAQEHRSDEVTASFDRDDVTASFPASPVLEVPEQEPDTLWYMNRVGDERGPLTKSELVDILSVLHDRSSVRVRPDGTEDWRPYQEYREVMAAMGMNERRHIRAPFAGDFAVTWKDKNYFFEVQTLSEGGLGIRGNFPWNEETPLEGSLVSKVFRQPLFVTGKIIRNGENSSFAFYPLDPMTLNYIRNYTKLFAPSTDESSLSSVDKRNVA
ncbi:MAG: GYF domain-containing protein [Bdellovibrionales bacterium]|nr:GYF domain-containing protein [Bdellovibrionales bacterium]